MNVARAAHEVRHDADRECAGFVKRGAVPTKAQIRRVYADQLAPGRERFENYFRGRGKELSREPSANQENGHAS
jgi:hypothetical protein